MNLGNATLPQIFYFSLEFQKKVLMLICVLFVYKMFMIFLKGIWQEVYRNKLL